MAHQFKVKRKDGKGWWTLPHMDQEHIDGLIGGEDTGLHTHDQRYYTETEIDANIYTKTEVDAIVALYLPLAGGDLTGPVTSTDLITLANNKYYAIKNTSGDAKNMVYLTTSNIAYLSHADFVTNVQGSTVTIRSNSQNSMVFGASDIQGNLLLDLTAGLTMDGGGLTIDSILDQDDFYSDSDTALATQQSIKAYIDGHTDFVRHDGTIALSADWDVGTPLIKSDEIRSRLGTDTGLKLSNRGNTGFIFIEDGSEHVGINVADPDKVLDVYQSVGSVLAQFTTGAANCFLEFLDSSTGSNKVYLGAIGDDLVLFGDGTSALRITTSGLIDVANSAAVLDEDTLGTDSATQLATQQSIKAYIDNKSYLDLGSILTGDGAYVGTKMTVTVDDASTIFGDVLAQAADFKYDRADADAAANSVGLVMALSSGSGSMEVLIEGQVCETDWTWSAGLLYLSTTTGKMTQTAPSGTGDQVVAVGWALSADTIYFKPSLVLVEVA